MLINFYHYCIAPEACLSSGCSVVYSRKYTMDHDAICPYKIVQCQRECGDTFPRRLQEKHMNEACPLRPVLCPMADIGCAADLLYINVPDHMMTAGTAHLLLAVEKIREQSRVIADLQTQVFNLENDMLKANRTLETLTAGAAAGTNTFSNHDSNHDSLLNYFILPTDFIVALVAIEVSEKRTYHRLSDEMNRLESKLSQQTHRVSQEISSLAKTQGKTHSQLASLEKQVQPMIAATRGR